MRIAIVGTGISGMLSAWLLARRHDVTVFEAADRIGGHTNTVDVDIDGRRFAVDTGFIVFNDWTYPNFIRLLTQLGVESQPSTMSFSVRSEKNGLEYNGTSLNTLFAQRTNLLRPSFYRMIREILRFNREALELLEGSDDTLTLGDYLASRKYADSFVENYILPMGAAIWSASPARMRGFPVRYFVQFFKNHGMLNVDDRPQWRVVRGGSMRYMEALARPLQGKIRLNAPIRRVTRFPDRVEVETVGGPIERFDQVVIAAHSDQALALLTDPSSAERSILGAIAYQENEAVLHTDRTLLPRRKLAWASWNYHVMAAESERVAVTYYMNMLQGLDSPTPICVTLNRTESIDPTKILKRIVYHHPVYTPGTVNAQSRRHEISGVQRTWYCGAYWGFGFHEDGVQSALAVCERMGARLAS